MLERVAAIDVAKASGKVCTRVPHPSVPSGAITRVWDVAATTNAIMALADELAELGIERVVVESTSDYWRPFFYLLEARGLCVWLVNARDVKNVPGRPKTDKLDAIWLAKLNERGMLRPVLRPADRDPRAARLHPACASSSPRSAPGTSSALEKLLEDALIKLSTVATDIFGVSGRAMLEALIAGERDPDVLAELALGQMRAKHAALVEALTGRFDDHHAELARMLLDQIDALGAKIDALTARIDELIAEHPGRTGAGRSETGEHRRRQDVAARGRRPPRRGPRHRATRRAGDHRRDRPRHGPVPDRRATSCPGRSSHRARSSPGPKSRSGRTGKGNPYLKGVLGEAATAAAKTDTFLGERYRRLVRRRGKIKRARRGRPLHPRHRLAPARRPDARFIDLGPDFYERRINKDRRTRNLVRQLQALGHQVTLSPAA